MENHFGFVVLCGIICRGHHSKVSKCFILRAIADTAKNFPPRLPPSELHNEHLCLSGKYEEYVLACKFIYYLLRSLCIPKCYSKHLIKMMNLENCFQYQVLSLVYTCK